MSSAAYPIDRSIVRLSQLLLHDRNAFEELAQQLAQVISVRDLPYLRRRFHDAPPVPAGLDPAQFGLGQWMAICQRSIFELIYTLGPEALDFLKDIAFGVYDWTQALALETLCRLGVDGTIDATIFDEIDQRLSGIRYEAHLYFASDMLARARRDIRFFDVLESFNDPDFQEALLEILEEE